MQDKKGLLTMPEIFNGIEYLNAKESAAYLNMSYVTFQRVRDMINPRTGKPNLQSHEIIGRGRTRFYKLEDLKTFKEEQVRPQ